MTTRKTFGAIAQRLADKGYEPVPIVRGEKRPAPAAWQQGGWEAHSEKYDKNFTGILTRYTPGVDCDVSDDELVKQIRAIVFDVTGCHEMPPPRRIGNAPRELLLFRTEEPFAKLSTATYRLPFDKNDKDSKVEILADGQQFVAYAIHPDTKAPYQWNGGGEPLVVDRDKLVTLDEAQAREIIARCDALLALHGVVIERSIGTASAIGYRTSADRLEADDPIMAMAAIGAMPNPNLPFDDFIRCLYAVKAALGEDGKDVFMAWSAKSDKHDASFSEREWNKAKPIKVGAGTVIWMARQLGWSPMQPAIASATSTSTSNASQPSALIWPHMSSGKNPRPLATLENFEALSNFLGVTYAMDVMRGQEIVHIPGMSVAEGTEANSAVTHMMSQAILAGFPHALVPDFMAMLCAQNPFHPVHQWIAAQPWDGRSRLQAWMDTIDSPNKRLKEAMMRKWAISAIAALYRPGGVSAHGVLTLLGEQGLGKTSWFLALTPKEYGFAKDGMILRPDSPDSVRQVTSQWLVELGELDATFKRSDIAALKAFITQASDTYRLPYARKNTVNPRRTVFFASVNDERFLSDNTGNRRYWTIDCRSINYEHSIDMQQFWAEIKTIYDAGETWFLDSDEVLSLNESNEQFTTIDPIAERLADGLDWSADQSKWVWMTSTAVALAIGISHPLRGDVTRIALLLNQEQRCTTKRSNGVTKKLVPPAVEQEWTQ